MPSWQRQAVVRALVMGEMRPAEIAAECGVSVRMVHKIRFELDTCTTRQAYARCTPRTRMVQHG